jgi:hypothetical protein
LLGSLAARRWHPLWALLISGVLGFRVGYVAFPTWHVAVQSAQVVAGLVDYPADNPFYVYHTKLWTLLHQLVALLLLGGLSEIQISLFLSGLLGMLAFQALTLFVYAFSRSLLLAIGAAFLVFFSRAAEYGVVYPVLLMGTEHTYGSLGLSVFVLVLGLLASGCLPFGGLMLGAAPALHPSLGAWLWLTIAIVFVAGGRKLRAELKPSLPYVAAGAAITAISLAVQFAFIYDVPDVDPARVRPYIEAFIAFWDGHRRPVDHRSPGVMLNAAALAVAAIWLVRRRQELTAGAAVAATGVIVSAGLSLVFVTLTWIPPAHLPLWLLMLMPARLLNVAVMAFAPMLLGLAASRASGTAGALLALGISGGLLFGRSSVLWDQLGRQQAPFETLSALQVAAVFTLLLGLLPSSRPDRVPVASTGRGRLTFVRWAARVAVLAIAAYAASKTWSLRQRPALYDRTNDTLFALAAQDATGLIATDGSFHLAQLLTRRPVLINAGALDTLSYAPESALAMNRILLDVYELDLLKPPAGIAPGQGLIPDDFNKPVWERYSREKWQEIRRTYNVTQVLTRASYDLDLPVEAQVRGVRLYSIPESAEPSPSR